MNQKKIKNLRRKTKQIMRKELESGLASYIKSLQAGKFFQRLHYCIVILFKLDYKKGDI